MPFCRQRNGTHNYIHYNTLYSTLCKGHAQTTQWTWCWLSSSHVAVIFTGRHRTFRPQRPLSTDFWGWNVLYLSLNIMLRSANADWLPNHRGCTTRGRRHTGQETLSWPYTYKRRLSNNMQHNTSLLKHCVHLRENCTIHSRPLQLSSAFQSAFPERDYLSFLRDISSVCTVCSIKIKPTGCYHPGWAKGWAHPETRQR